MVNNGAREIILLGQNVNAYKYNGKRLSDLICKISQIKDLERIRYTTSHPVDFTKDLIEAHGVINKLMPYVHLPIQSGSNKILKNMNRNHTTEFYLELINKLKSTNPKIKFSSDFIIGYPGEMDIDFEKTINIIKKIQYINTYSFLFSPRPGTPAAKLEKIEINEAKKRLSIFKKTAEEIKSNYRKSLLNKSSIVLFENKTKNKNEFFGKDEFSNPVIVRCKENLEGKIKKVRITHENSSTLFGSIDSANEKKDFAA